MSANHFTLFLPLAVVILARKTVDTFENQSAQLSRLKKLNGLVWVFFTVLTGPKEFPEK